MLFKNAEVAGEAVDVRCADEIEEVARGLEPRRGEVVVDARGCALLPGLHDHHLHFFALAAARVSVDLRRVATQTAMGELLADAVSRSGWIRAVGYHESRHGDLDRFVLDRFCPTRPVRVQHSSGKLWVMNSVGCEALELHERADPGVEYIDGQITGRLFRLDARLRESTHLSAKEIKAASLWLASLGLTGFTDASFTNDHLQAQRFDAVEQSVYVMGDETLASGHLKIMLDDDDLPALGALVQRIERAHAAGRGVAFHAISRAEVLFALTALEACQPTAHPQDRIEHAGVVGTDMLDALARGGVAVVTQPGFLADRGALLIANTGPVEAGDLYRYASLKSRGIPVAASSDAPFGPVNPWQVMQAAVERRCDNGVVLSPEERVTPQEALRAYLSRPQDPGGVARRVEAGAAADLCLIDRSLDAALADLGSVSVLVTVRAGAVIYDVSNT